MPCGSTVRTLRCGVIVLAELRAFEVSHRSIVTRLVRPLLVEMRLSTITKELDRFVDVMATVAKRGLPQYTPN